jgi:2-polyprenyl-6-methoxyphenol hydroxylase-like FAD-dependent oxidoreductase
VILIVGAGIGGLAAAVALRRAGFPVLVLERAPDLREDGAALALGVNAMAALRELGVADAVLAAGRPIARGEIRTPRGDVLMAVEVEDLARRRGVPWTCVMRADLKAALLAAAGTGAVRLGGACEDVRDEADAAIVRLAGGQEVRGAAAVGADGIGSAVRRALGDASAPRYAGYVAWRGVAPFDAADATAVEAWGRGRRFGFVPLSGGRTYWFATRNQPSSAPETKPRKDDVRGEFAGWHAPIPELVESTDAGAILRHDVFDRTPTRRWGRGRSTLLGDAAHPMTPNLSQGACQAIEDAVVLARSLSADSDVPRALRAYEDARAARTSSIVLESRRVGRLGQFEGRAACLLRDAALRLVPKSVVRRSIERVQGWTP